MSTDMVHARSDAARFALWGTAWSLGLFGLFRLPWTEAHALLPFTRAQAAAAVGLFGAPTSPIDITLACSGTDAVALCLAAVLAYPATWRARLAGVSGGLALVLTLNMLRIGTLGRAAASPAWFGLLHLYVWPALLTIAIAAYVFAWMRAAGRPSAVMDGGTAGRSPIRLELSRPSSQFVLYTVGFLLLFSLASPLYLQSASVLAMAAFVARSAAVILNGIGVSASGADNVLWTTRGGFVVTQECIATPLIPVYLAGLFAWSASRKHLLLGLLATVPIFIALGIARLLVVALPAAVVGSPLFLVHAFYQLLLGAVLVVLVALWRHERTAAIGRAVAGIVLGVLFFQALGPLYTRAISYPAGLPVIDPQGAIALLPAFQMGLYLALLVVACRVIVWRRLFAGLALMGLTQVLGLFAWQALAHHSSFVAPVSEIRAWALVGPMLMVALVVNRARPTR